MATADDEARRRRLGILLIGAVLLLFVGQMVALAIGSLEVAALIFIVFIIGWFVLRSYIRGRERAEP
jgi:positive regulator of sigma E activity